MQHKPRCRSVGHIGLCVFSQARIIHNKQRNKLKEIMQTVSQNGEVNTAELQLAAKLAKIDLPEEFLLHTPYARKYASGWDTEMNSPRGVKWRPFYEAIDYPKIQKDGTEQFLTEHAAREAKRADARAVAAARAAADAAARAGTPSGTPSKARRDIPYVSDEDLRRAHAVIKARLSSQFGEIRQAFRAFDADASGFITAEEAEKTIGTLNLGLPKRIVSRLVDIADFDGDGEISFAEFARVLTAEDIIWMKDSLRAAGAENGKVDSRLKGHAVKRAPKVIKNGVTEDDIRNAVFNIKEKIIAKYKRLDSAFKDIDTDRTGYLSKEEFRFCLLLLNLDSAIDTKVIDVLLELVDSDGDNEINHTEFVAMLSANDPMKVFRPDEY